MYLRSGSKILLLALTAVLTGCATYYQPRYGHDGVYYDPPRTHYRSSVHVGYFDPVIYPYWSLDYFYFSRHYHPYSVVVHRYDPWFYPYPGWYYGYRPGPRSRMAFGYGSYYYPWFGFGLHYHHYHPWNPGYISYPRHRPTQYSQSPPGYQRVRVIDDRLRDMDRRQRLAASQGGRGPAPADPARIGIRDQYIEQSEPSGLTARERSAARRQAGRAGTSRPSPVPGITPTDDRTPSRAASSESPAPRPQNRIPRRQEAPVQEQTRPARATESRQIPRRQSPVTRSPTQSSPPRQRQSAPPTRQRSPVQSSPPPQRSSPPPPRRSAPPARSQESEPPRRSRERRQPPI
jgi:hypothetical protein